MRPLWIKCVLFLRRKCVSVFHFGLAVAILIFLLHPDRNARGYYRHLSRQEALEELVPVLTRNVTATSTVECDYNAVLFTDSLLEEPLHTRPYALAEGPSIHDGGEFVPRDCKPMFSTAVIVPYRDRAEQLHAFLVHMHNFLRRQNIHYRIYVVEQINIKPFNRAKLLNIGAAHATRDGFPCLVLNDVDLLPLHLGNIYACTKNPRHMSSSINKFRYTLPYLSLFGGAVSILATQFKAINGMSNQYFGWGAEDDDLSKRITDHGLSFCRFDPEISRYYMVRHKAEPKGEKNDNLLSDAAARMQSDGLNSLEYSEVSTVLHPLFTHIMVDL